MARGWKTALFLLAVLALFLVCALWSGLTLRFYGVRTDKLTQDARLRLALLTDLHSCVYGENHRELLDLVLDQRPDVILLGGDIVDDVEPLENALSFFESLSQTGIPAYYVSGNHDRWRPDFASVLETIRGYGITVLEGNMVTLDLAVGQVNLCGIQEYANAEDCAAALEATFSTLSPDAYNILLAHRPDYIDLYRQYPFDLVLSGHTHGGQVCIPLLVNGLFAPNQGWLPNTRADSTMWRAHVSSSAAACPTIPGFRAYSTHRKWSLWTWRARRADAVFAVCARRL